MNAHVNGETKVCALIGHPAGHTLSPLLHNTLARSLGVNMVYTAFDVEPDHLKEALDGAYALGIHGLNITVPHKQAAAELAKSMDRTAAQIGAVNTLVYSKKRGGYEGYNTDVSGLKRALKEDDVSLKGKDVIIVGAGGVARAALVLAAQDKAKRVFLMNRTLEHATRLADEIGHATGYGEITALSLSDMSRLHEQGVKGAVCFQCTNVGMHPLTENTPLDDPDFFTMTDAVYDMIYRPEETTFLRMARDAGVPAHNGLRMLLYQGVEAFEKWFDVSVPEEQLEEAYQQMQHNLTDKKTIVLTGFMGSGKSTISKLLSDMLDEPLVDLDTEIELRVRTTISDIFAVRGEEAFRDIESRILQEVAGTGRLPFILSTGGGLPIREQNRKAMREIGTVVYLKTSPEEVYRRLNGDVKRPLLQTDNPYETIMALEKERDEYYNLAADITIVTDGMTPEEVADNIIKKVFAE